MHCLGHSHLVFMKGPGLWKTMEMQQAQNVENLRNVLPTDHHTAASNFLQIADKVLQGSCILMLVPHTQYGIWFVLLLIKRVCVSDDSDQQTINFWRNATQCHL